VAHQVYAVDYLYVMLTRAAMRLLIHRTYIISNAHTIRVNNDTSRKITVDVDVKGTVDWSALGTTCLDKTLELEPLILAAVSIRL